VQIAYLIGRYPGITHTFILREVRVLRRLGIGVQSFSIWRTAQRELLSPVDWEEWRNTDTLLPPRPARFFGAHVRGLTRAPLTYAATLRRALTLSSPGIRGRLLGLTWFIEAIVLSDACRRRGIRHIHAHLDGTAPMVAMLAVEFANRSSWAGGPQSWSQTIHGSKEFYDVYRERLAVKATSARFIACISDYTRSQVMAFVPEELWHKLVVVRCGVDLDEFSPRDSGKRAPGQLRILTIGRIDAMKGTVLLLHAMVRLSKKGLRPTLTIVGDGSSKDKAMRMSERLGLGSQVRWEGAIGQDRIREFYAECDVFCLPSFAEGVPIVLMEAMAMEVPVVANAITGIVELVDDGVNGFLVRPGRLDELTDRLARLLEDPGLRGSMGRAGRAKVADEYDLERNVKRLARILADGPAWTVDGLVEPSAIPVQATAGHHR
jgi:colanic acid/amylovoran biosynthesis glycosyltransferase